MKGGELGLFLCVVIMIVCYTGTVVFTLWRLEQALANLTDLQAAINTLPEAVTSQVVDVVKPLLTAAATPADTQPQIDAINQVPGIVANAVRNALANPPA